MGTIFKYFSALWSPNFFFLVPLSVEYRLQTVGNWSHGCRFLFFYGAFCQWRRYWRNFRYESPKIFIFTNFFRLKRRCMVKLNLIFREKRFYWDFNSRWEFLKTLKSCKVVTDFHFFMAGGGLLKFLSCHATCWTAPILIVISEVSRQVLWTLVHVLWKIL